MELQELISLSLEETLTEIYDQLGITTGDISPIQAMQWNEITQAAAALFSELIEQNKGDF
jgi:hypothetical protein